MPTMCRTSQSPGRTPRPVRWSIPRGASTLPLAPKNSSVTSPPRLHPVTSSPALNASASAATSQSNQRAPVADPAAALVQAPPVQRPPAGEAGEVAEHRDRQQQRVARRQRQAERRGGGEHRGAGVAAAGQAMPAPILARQHRDRAGSERHRNARCVQGQDGIEDHGGHRDPRSYLSIDKIRLPRPQPTRSVPSLKRRRVGAGRAIRRRGGDVRGRRSKHAVDCSAHRLLA